MQTKNIFQNSKKQSGVGMVELLVALVLSSVVAIVVIQLFIQTKISYTSHESISRMQENGRYALQLLSQSLRSSDYWGCLPLYDVDNAVLDIPLLEPAQINGRVANVANINDAIVAQDGAAGNWNSLGFPDAPDTVTVSGVHVGRSFPLAANVVGTDNIRIDIGASATTGITPNDLMIISDCKNATLFQVTNDPDTTITGGEAIIAHGLAPNPAPNPGNYQNNFADLGADYVRDRSRVHHGFVGNTTFTVAMDDPDGAGPEPAIPTLMRNNVPMVPGVETLQLVWGIDTTTVPRPDGQPDIYVNTAGVANWETVVSARISIVVRSPEAVNDTAVGYTLDGRTVAAASLPIVNGKFHSRRVYSTTVTFRNRAP